jgi:hypothetical protein
LNIVAALMLTTFTATAATMAMAANRAMSPCVGAVQISGANTLAMATAIDAVPTKNDSSAVQPLNQPYSRFTIRLDHW